MQLLLGLICGRYLQRHARAALHLRSALQGLTLASQRTLAENELRQVEQHMPENDSDPRQ